MIILSYIMRINNGGKLVFILCNIYSKLAKCVNDVILILNCVMLSAII
jgi:hypothetical protein